MCGRRRCGSTSRTPRYLAWCATWSWRSFVDAEDLGEVALVALGANLADPHATLVAAVDALAELGEVRRVSRLYRTAPVGGPPGQPAYRNAVAAVAPRPELRDPQALLAALHDLETRFGRRRRIRWEARQLDLDLLAFGDAVRHQPGLELPHPRMMERAFVLAPLRDVAPAWRHPVDGRAAAEALASLDASGVEVSEERWTPR